MGHFVVSRCALYLIGPRGLALASRARRCGATSRARRSRPTRRGPRSQQLAGPRRVAELPRRSRCAGGWKRPGWPWPCRSPAGDASRRSPGHRGARLPDTVLGGGPGLRRDPGPPGRRRAGERPPAPAPGGEAAPGPRAADSPARSSAASSRARVPEMPGFEVAAESRSCYEVGGDSYDWIPLGGGRLALVIADVSGKGTPASLLMASVHAYVQALAGTAAPGRVIARLNRFLFASTQTSRYRDALLCGARRGDRAGSLTSTPATSRRTACPADGTVQPARGRAGPPWASLTGRPTRWDEMRLEPGDVAGHGHGRRDRGQLSRRTRVRRRAGLRGAARPVRRERGRHPRGPGRLRSPNGRAPRVAATT